MHPLEKIAKHYFGVTDNLEETGYVLSDGTFLDLSGRHEAVGYVRKGDRFVPKKRQPDYLYGQRNTDHRQLPSEIFQAVGTGEGSAAMFAFLRETGALRLMSGAGFLVARMPTVESVARVVREWHHAFGNEPLYVDVVSPGSRPDRASRVINPDDVRESHEFKRPSLEEVMAFLEDAFASQGRISMGNSAILRFSDLPEQQRGEVLDHIPLKKARKTRWRIRQVEPEFVYREYGLPGVDQDQVRLLEDRIRSEGFNVPIVVDGIDGWMEGNHRTVAAKRFGLETIPAYTREK